MLRIGLDLRPTEAGFKAHAGRGTGRYTMELVSRLCGNLVDSSNEGRVLNENDELSLVPVHTADLVQGEAEARLLASIPLGRRTFESQVLYPRRIKKLGVDAIHFFAHGDAPARCSIPQIVTVLDLIPLRFPELYRASKRNLRFRFARYLEHEAIRRSAGILAISEATKRDLVELLGVADEKIRVTPLAASGLFTCRELHESTWRERITEQRKSLAIQPERPLLLYVGGIDPRKNVVFMLEVFAELLRSEASQPLPYLVLAGGYEKDDQFPHVKAALRRLGIEEHVGLPGFVSDERLLSLYHAADCVLFPSLYEGFGLPVLEAMACGVPVVAGKNSSIPEVAGSAALLCPDRETAEWVRSIREVLDSRQLQHQMSVAGHRQAKRFSWDTTAEKTLESYRDFLGCGTESGQNSGTARITHRHHAANI